MNWLKSIWQIYPILSFVYLIVCIGAILEAIFDLIVERIFIEDFMIELFGGLLGATVAFVIMISVVKWWKKFVSV